MGVAADKVKIVVGDIEFFFDNRDNVAPPFLGVFGKVDPGTGKLADTEILDMLVD